MNALEQFLSTDPQDAGCAETMRLLSVYVDALLAGQDPERRHPGIAAHLQACSPCNDDMRGLIAAVLGSNRTKEGAP
jgi:hypothetical protein